MQGMSFRVIGLSLGVALSVVAYQAAPAKTKPPKQENLQGTVRMINKDKSEITVHAAHQSADRVIVYNADTKFGIGTSSKSTPTTIDKLKQGFFLNCNGNYQGVQFAATFCYFREKG